MASFVSNAPGRADLQPNTSHCARLAGEESKPGGTKDRITRFRRLGTLPGRSSLRSPEATGRIGFGAMSPRSTETEVLAQELDSVGNKLRALEARLTEVEKIIERLEAAALTTARALEEVSTHWDKVYRAMRRAE